jgi:hypothetical protein
MSGTGDVGPANGGPDEDGPADGCPDEDGPAEGRPAEGRPAEGHPAEGHPAGGAADEQGAAGGGLPVGSAGGEGAEATPANGGSAGSPAGSAGSPAGSAGSPAGSAGSPAGSAGSPAGGAQRIGQADGAADSRSGDKSRHDAAPADGGSGSSAVSGAHGGGPADRGAAEGGAGEPLGDGAAGAEGGEVAAAAGGGGGDAAHGASATAGPDGPADPGELLGEVRAIRRRTRLARHAYWFPLVLFGLLTLASVPFYIRRFPPTGGGFAIRSGLNVLQSGFLGGPGLLEVAHGTAYYWLGAMLLGITATVVWYRWRGNRVGLRTPARGYLITGLALLALTLLVPVVSGRSVRMPLLWPGDYVISDLVPLVLIGLGLFVLAWSERSTGLAAIAAGYFAIAVAANLYTLSNLLSRLHWDLNPTVAALPNVVLPALVLLLTGAGAWVVQRRSRPRTEPESAES